MKLLRALERTEKRADERLRRRNGTAWGIVWTEEEEPLGRELVDGEYLAVDVHVIEVIDGGTCRARTVERATADPLDRGRVYDVNGGLAGRVDSRDSGLMSLEVAKGAG